MRKLLLVGLMALGAGCSTTSTITRVNGPSVEGDIVGGSPDEIFVSNDAGGDFAIPRRDIEQIDYPGNVHTLIGGITAGVGIFNIMSRFDECQHEHDAKAAVCSGVFLPLAVGAAIMTWGIIVNQGQKSAAADRSRPSLGGGERGAPYPIPDWASGNRVAPPPQVPPPPRKPTDGPPPAPPPPPGASATAPSPAEPLPPPPPVSPAPEPTAPAPPAPPSKGFPVEK